ncbi:MAG: hypothetical protein Q8K75_01930 [Chlamydiales bacterium]|nr:hypothetical protein [Chlamydiales bacterium]
MVLSGVSSGSEYSPSVDPEGGAVAKGSGKVAVQKTSKPLGEVFASKDSTSISIKALKTLKINQDSILSKVGLNKAHKERRIDALGAGVLAGVEKSKGDPIESLATTLEMAPHLSDAQLETQRVHIEEAAGLLIGDDKSDKADQIRQAAQKVVDRQVGVRDRHLHLGKCVTAQEAERLCKQQKQCPLIKECLQYLRGAYEVPEDPAFTPQIAGKVWILHNNLKKISEVVSSFENQPEILQGLTLQDFPMEYRVTMGKYLSGNRTLTEAGVAEFRQAIEALASKSPSAEASAVPSISPKGRITESALANQTKLQKVKRDGKAWLLKQEAEVAALGISANIVKKVYDNDGKLIGYYKIGAQDEEAASAMEHFMYDAAVLMGMERRFVPTGRMDMITKQDISNSSKGKEVGIIDDKGDFRTINLETHAFDRPRGSIQAAHEGQTLNQLHGDKKDLNMEETIIGVTTQIGMGMFDAHGSNVLVDEGGKISFFDNSRSLPQTNRPMAWAGKVIPPFRSGFLRSDQAYEPLSEVDRDSLRAEAALWKERVGELRHFVDLPSSKARLEGLPAGWWNSKNILAAMSERAEAMERAASDPDVVNLRDFMFACYPDLKFYAVLHVALRLEENLSSGYIDPSELARVQKDHHGLAKLGYDPIDTIIDGANYLGLDVLEIREWCQGSSLNFEQVMDKVATAAKDAMQVGPAETENRKRAAESLLSNVKATAAIELKDVSRANCLRIQQEKAIELMRRAGLKVDMEGVFDPDDKPLGFTLCRASSTMFTLCEKTLDGLTKLSKIDLSDVFEGHLYTIDDSGDRDDLLVSLANKVSALPDHIDMSIDGEGAEAILPINTWLIRRPDGYYEEIGNFVISVNDNGKVVHCDCRFNKSAIIISDEAHVLIENEKQVQQFANIEAVEALLQAKGYSPYSKKEVDA